MGSNPPPEERLDSSSQEPPPPDARSLPRNVWAASGTSFFMDISSEMLINLLPLFLANVLGATTIIIGAIEGIAESIASLLKVFSGWLSDRIGNRKWLAVAGYGLSALIRPLFYFAQTWATVGAARWLDRTGKGIRTAPRDALLADSIQPEQRGRAFGFHRAADTAGAAIGVGIALAVVWARQAHQAKLAESTFRFVVLASIIPAVLAVLVLAVGAREPQKAAAREKVKIGFSRLGRPFLYFMVIVGLFELGNSSDAFLILRAQERGLTVEQVLLMVLCFSVVYALVATPGGSLSDRIGRRPVIIAGWIAYAVIYLGFALARTGWQIWGGYVLYGLYYGLGYGTQRALVADLVPPHLRGTAYGSYNAAVGLLAFPASLIAGALWQGVGAWKGFGPSAPFLFGAVMALLASLLLALWRPPKQQ